MELCSLYNASFLNVDTGMTSPKPSLLLLPFLVTLASEYSATAATDPSAPALPMNLELRLTLMFTERRDDLLCPFFLPDAPFDVFAASWKRFHNHDHDRHSCHVLLD